MRLVRLENDEGSIRIRVLGWQQQIDGADRRSARLKRQEAAKFLTLRIGVQPVQLLGNRGARNFRHATGSDTTNLPFAMDIEKLKGAFPAHGALLRWGFSPS